LKKHLAHYALADRAYRDGPFPVEVKTVMLAHFLPSFGMKNSLFHLVHQCLVGRCFVEKGILSPLRELVEVEGIRGAHFHKHHFRCGDSSFSTMQMGFNPADAVGHLSGAILEKDVVDGCIKCGFGNDVEADQHCETCLAGPGRKGGGLRTMLREKGHPSFGRDGWPVFREMAGAAMSSLLEDMATFYQKIHSDSCFADRCFDGILDTDGMTYLGGKADDWLFMRKRRSR
jgi:hypothetical protein